MSIETKGQSPFYPGQPVPVELFVGRKAEIDRILRAASQVTSGKPQAIFISGEYGIGKSSLAMFMRKLLRKRGEILGFHTLLGSINSVDEIASKTVENILSSDYGTSSTGKNIKNFLGEYIGEQGLFGVKLRLDKLKQDAPDISKGFLPFLRKIFEASKGEFKGLMLVLDEINGIASKATFGTFIKSLVDENALSDSPLPLLLVLCGTEERYREIVEKHKPVERIFNIAHIDPMTKEEAEDFFNSAYSSVGIKINKEATGVLTKYSGGLPKLMHLIGDAAYWIAKDNKVTTEVAYAAVFDAAEEVGRKFIDQQVYKALRSKDYHKILIKLTDPEITSGMTFRKKEVEENLTAIEKKKFNNFLQRMKKLNVLHSGEEKGEYVFRDQLTRLYLLLASLKSKSK